jgi:hypothetical protein
METVTPLGRRDNGDGRFGSCHNYRDFPSEAGDG